MGLPDDVRSACACVAARAGQVRVNAAAIPAYARALPAESPPAPDLAPGASDERRAAFGLQLNAVNFGSGWFPTLRKPPGLSGFRTMEAGLRARGPWTAEGLTQVDAAEVASTFGGQDPEHELMPLFARALRELGEHARAEHGGSFLALARSGEGSAVALAERLGALPTWRDVSPYDGRAVPFFKRAQLAAADLHLQGLAPAADTARLTLFADNLVPHVLRIDGVLAFDPALVARIDREELLAHDSPEEVEIRACAPPPARPRSAARGPGGRRSRRSLDHPHAHGVGRTGAGGQRPDPRLVGGVEAERPDAEPAPGAPPWAAATLRLGELVRGQFQQPLARRARGPRRAPAQGDGERLGRELGGERGIAAAPRERTEDGLDVAPVERLEVRRVGAREQLLVAGSGAHGQYAVVRARWRGCAL